MAERPVRASLSLDGVWQARLDSEAEFDRMLRVPMPWQVADPALRDYTGVVWYRRLVEVPDEWRGGDVFVRFGAVDYQATVYADGRDVGGHQGGYTPFEVAIPDGTRELTLRVEDPEDLSELPHGKQGGRWYTRVSGPWQSVELLVRPRERVEWVRVYPDALAGTARVDVLARLNGGARHLRVEAIDAAGALAATAEALVSADVPNATLHLDFARPRVWAPDDPHLYALRVVLDGADVLEQRLACG